MFCASKALLFLCSISLSDKILMVSTAFRLVLVLSGLAKMLAGLHAALGRLP